MLNFIYFEVPRIRPRFILIAYRKDIFDKKYLKLNYFKINTLNFKLKIFKIVL